VIAFGVTLLNSTILLIIGSINPTNIGICLLYYTSQCNPLKNAHSMSLIPSPKDYMALYGIFSRLEVEVSFRTILVVQLSRLPNSLLKTPHSINGTRLASMISGVKLRTVLSCHKSWSQDKGSFLQ
jgi:hypothetical protein